MACTLLDLSTELLLLVRAELLLYDLIALSTTCSRLRELCAPSVFKYISFTTDKGSAESALAAVRRYGQHTRSMDFVGTSWPQKHVSLAVGVGRQTFRYEAEKDPFAISRPDGVSEDEDEDDAGDYDPKRWLGKRCLTEAAEELLKGTFTPNLNALGIEVMFDLDNEDLRWAKSRFSGIEDVFDDVESPEETQLEEGAWRWRAFNAAVWRAVCANSHVTHLDVMGFIPKATSVFAEEQFPRLLGRLHDFNITFYQAEDGWEGGSAFHEFVDDMASTWFGRMSSLKHLEIRGHESLPLGLYDRDEDNFVLPLNEASMPQLESLTLCSSFAGSDLIDFVSRHRVSMKCLSLNFCYCPRTYAGAWRDITWEHFFDELLATKPSLSVFKFDGFYGQSPYSCFEEWWHHWNGYAYYEDEEGSPEWLRRKEVFWYADVEDVHGTVQTNGDVTADADQRVRDLAAFDKFMGLVEENKAAAL